MILPNLGTKNFEFLISASVFMTKLDSLRTNKTTDKPNMHNLVCNQRARKT